MQHPAIHKFTVESFRWKDKLYNVALTRELYVENNTLEFNGGYQGILIDPDKGSIAFSLMPDPDYGWNVEPKAMIDPNVMDELDRIISKINEEF